MSQDTTRTPDRPDPDPKTGDRKVWRAPHLLMLPVGKTAHAFSAPNADGLTINSS